MNKVSIRVYIEEETRLPCCCMDVRAMTLMDLFSVYI